MSARVADVYEKVTLDIEASDQLKAYEGFVSPINAELIKQKALKHLTSTDGSPYVIANATVETSRNRTARILKNDLELMEHTRLNMVKDEVEAVKKMIEEHGDTIIDVIDCVAFLNAPQSFGNHFGDSKLFVAKRDDPVQKGKILYTIFFYCYAESPHYESREKMSILGSLFWNLNIRDKASRSAHGVLLSISMHEIINSYHQVHDTNTLENIITGGNNTCCNCCNLKCCEDLECCGCNKKMKWSLEADGRINTLNKVIAQKEKIVKNDVIVNPLMQGNRPIETFEYHEISSKKLHTIYLTYSDGLENVRKGVIILSPTQHTKSAMNLVFLITSLTQCTMEDRIKHKELLKGAKLDLDDPLAPKRYFFGKDRTTPMLTEEEMPSTVYSYLTSIVGNWLCYK